MEQTEHHFSHPKNYRYYLSGDLTHSKVLWVVLHGYGQLPFYFQRKFQSLGDGHCVLAPEGPHRFYLEGTSGRVGASWMTKEDRLTDINDNNLWLAALVEQFRSSVEKVVLLGFSQGGATAARLYISRSDLFHHLVLWASVFPPDLQQQAEFSGKENYFLLGDEDPYFSQEQQNAQLQEYQNKGFHTILFHGNHDISEKPLLELAGRVETK